ncbi:MAG: hypothetical protein EOO11_19845, partial [Chitinophagaceae bacterium]
MNHSEFQQRAEARWGRRRLRHDNRHGRIWTGLFLLVVGSVLLAHRAGVDLPPWLLSWPLLLIGVGLWMGARHRFRGYGWLLPILIGGIAFVDDIRSDLNLRPYIWPLVLIGAGLAFIFRPRRRAFAGDDDSNQLPPPAPDGPGEWAGADDRSDLLDVS